MPLGGSAHVLLASLGITGGRAVDTDALQARAEALRLQIERNNALLKKFRGAR